MRPHFKLGIEAAMNVNTNRLLRQGVLGKYTATYQYGTKSGKPITGSQECAFDVGICADPANGETVVLKVKRSYAW